MRRTKKLERGTVVGATNRARAKCSGGAAAVQRRPQHVVGRAAGIAGKIRMDQPKAATLSLGASERSRFE